MISHSLLMQNGSSIARENVLYNAAKENFLDCCDEYNHTSTKTPIILPSKSKTTQTLTGIYQKEDVLKFVENWNNLVRDIFLEKDSTVSKNDEIKKIFSNNYINNYGKSQQTIEKYFYKIAEDLETQIKDRGIDRVTPHQIAFMAMIEFIAKIDHAIDAENDLNTSKVFELLKESKYSEKFKEFKIIFDSVHYIDQTSFLKHIKEHCLSTLQQKRLGALSGICEAFSAHGDSSLSSINEDIPQNPRPSSHSSYREARRSTHRERSRENLCTTLIGLILGGITAAVLITKIGIVGIPVVGGVAAYCFLRPRRS